MKNKKGFTLLELLVVVLIIGILASIALPQYNKAVMKANLHKGMPMVESLYQAEQLYFLEHGEFATDIDDLALEVPHDAASCEKWEDEGLSGLNCPWGSVEIAWGNQARVNFLYPISDSTAQIAYTHLLEDWPLSVVTGGKFKQGFRYCFAKTANQTAKEVCQSIGGVSVGNTSLWTYYEIQ